MSEWPDKYLAYCTCGALLILVQRPSTGTLPGIESVWICIKGNQTGCPR